MDRTSNYNFREDGFAASAWMPRFYYSHYHIMSAAFFARESGRLERDNEAKESIPSKIQSEHRAFVSACIFSSVSFLEAQINELFTDAADDQREHIHQLGDFPRAWPDEQPARGAAAAAPGVDAGNRRTRLLKKSGGVLRERKVVKYACIRMYRHEFRLTTMCRALQVSRAGFYAAERRGPSARAGQDEVLRALITTLYQRSRQTYGSLRIHRDVRAGGWRCGRQRIVRLMQAAGLRARTKRRWRPQTTNSKHGHAVADNLLQRRFSVQEIGGSNRVWCGDVTYIRTGEGWLYLAALIDLGNRMVVGWAMGETLDAELCVKALRMALQRRRPKPGLLHHTDRGVQYAANDYRELLARHQLVASMSRRANCYDNAVAESFFATLRWELLHRHRWATRAEARNAIFEYIEVWYNRQRRHSALGFLSPWQFEQRLRSTA